MYRQVSGYGVCNGKANSIPIIAECASTTPLKTLTDRRRNCDCSVQYNAIYELFMFSIFAGTSLSQNQLSCERGVDWFSTESTCTTSQPFVNTLDLFEVRRNPVGTLNILVAREASSLQSVL